MYGSSLIQFSASCFHNISQTERRPKIKDKLFQYFLDLSMKCVPTYIVSIIRLFLLSQFKY